MRLRNVRGAREEMLINPYVIQEPQQYKGHVAVQIFENISPDIKAQVRQKGTVYIAKGGSQMRVIEKNRHEFVLSVREEGARNGLKPCADILYESLRESSFEDITCVIMTGMGADGTKGILQLKETNKIYVIAQNAESSTVYGMPKAIAESGAADEIKDLDLIADAIIKHVGVR